MMASWTLAHRLELVADEAEVQESDAEVEPRGGLVVLARVAPAGRPGQLRLRDHREVEDRHGAGLACMAGSVAEPEFHGPLGFEERGYVQAMVAVMLSST